MTRLGASSRVPSSSRDRWHLARTRACLPDLGRSGVVIGDDALEQFARVDAVLDFTVPSATVEFAGLAANARIVHVIGTTGFSPEQEAKIAAAGRHATIVKAGNMSLGVNLITALVKKVAAALDPDFDIEVVEMPSPQQDRCALRHSADAGRGCRAGARR